MHIIFGKFKQFYHEILFKIAFTSKDNNDRVKVHQDKKTFHLLGIPFDDIRSKSIRIIKKLLYWEYFTSSRSPCIRPASRGRSSS